MSQSETRLLSERRSRKSTPVDVSTMARIIEKIGVHTAVTHDFLNRNSHEVAGRPSPARTQEIGLVLQQNREWQLRRLHEVRKILQEVIPVHLLERTAVLIVGSDGRLENAPGSIEISPLEFCILAKDASDAEKVAQILGQVRESGRLLCVFSDYEIKLVGDPDFSISGYGGQSYYWPDRILDSIGLIGSEELMDEAISQTIEEWRTNKNVRAYVKDKRREFLKTCKTGIHRGKRHFDLQSGELLFNKAEYMRGLKYGPIRLLQVFLTETCLNQVHFEYGLNDRTVSSKLQHLFPDADTTEVAQAYHEALVYYHAQQQQRLVLDETDTIQIPVERLGWIVNTIANFVEEQIAGKVRS